MPEKKSKWETLEKKYGESEKPKKYEFKRGRKIPKKPILITIAVLVVIAVGYLAYPYIENLDFSFLFNFTATPSGTKYENPDLLLAQSKELFDFCLENDPIGICLALYHDDPAYCEYVLAGDRFADENTKQYCITQYDVVREIIQGNLQNLCDDKFIGAGSVDVNTCKCILNRNPDCNTSLLGNKTITDIILLSFYNNENSCAKLEDDVLRIGCEIIYTYLKVFENKEQGNCMEFGPISELDAYTCMAIMENDVNYCASPGCQYLYKTQQANILGNTDYCNQLVNAENKQKCISLMNYNLENCLNYTQPGLDVSLHLMSNTTSDRLINIYYKCLARNNNAQEICKFGLDEDKQSCYDQFNSG